MRTRSVTVILTLVVCVFAVAADLSSPPPARPQSADVLLNVFATGAGKINIAVPDFAVVSGADAQGFAKRLPEVVGHDLTFSALFNAGTGVAALPANNPAALREALAGFARLGAHYALQGLLSLQGARAPGGTRLS